MPLKNRVTQIGKMLLILIVIGSLQMITLVRAAEKIPFIGVVYDHTGLEGLDR